MTGCLLRLYINNVSKVVAFSRSSSVSRVDLAHAISRPTTTVALLVGRLSINHAEYSRLAKYAPGLGSVDEMTHQ